VGPGQRHRAKCLPGAKGSAAVWRAVRGRWLAVGALAGQGAKKGIFITTSNFTKEAIDYTPKNETKIVLIDRDRLAQLMIDYNLGCTTQQTYELKKIDSDYFDED
jgi:restriction system protein